MMISFFKGLRHTTPEAEVDLLDVLLDIQNGKWKEDVLKCREDLKSKELLPCFTPTGIFNHRSIKGLLQYNGNFCLDIDHIDDPESLKNKCKEISWIWSAFITPSGKGLKVIIKSNSTAEEFRSTEEIVAGQFKLITGFERDERCKDISRIQYVSYDPKIYINPQATIFKKEDYPTDAINP
jgi:hypothetical protein